MKSPVFLGKCKIVNVFYFSSVVLCSSSIAAAAPAATVAPTAQIPPSGLAVRPVAQANTTQMTAPIATATAPAVQPLSGSVASAAYLSSTSPILAAVASAPPVENQTRCVQDALATIASALSGKAEVSPSAIEALIERLGSESYVERELAQETLFRIGPQSIEKLNKKGVTSSDAEIRRRALSLIAAINNTGYSGSFLAVITRADMQPAAGEVLPSVLSMDLQIESRIPGLTILLRDPKDAVIELIVSNDGPLMVTEPYVATFSNWTSNSVRIAAKDFDFCTPPILLNNDQQHILVTLPVTIYLGCLPAGVKTTLVFEFKAAQIILPNC